MTRLRALLTALFLLGAIAGLATVGASPAYDLSVDDAISTPQESIEIEGSSYDIDGIGVIEPGDPISMSVQSDEDYRIFLYNQDEESEFSAGWSADEEHVTMGTADDDLDTAALEPGTYLLSLEPRGEGRQAVFPLVVEGYDLTIEHPTTIDTTEALEITASVEQGALTEPPSEVSVAIWDGEDHSQVSLEYDGNGGYSTTLEAGAFDPGSYEVYGGVPDPDASSGYETALAVTAGETLTVEEPEEEDDESEEDDEEESDDEDDSDDDDDSDEEDDGGDGDDSDDEGDSDDGDDSEEDDDSDAEEEADSEDDDDTDDAETPDEDDDEAAADEEDEAADDDDPDDTTTDESGDDSSDDDQDTGDDDQAGDTDDSAVIQPNETTADDADEDALGIPALAAITALALVLIARYRPEVRQYRRN